MKKKKCLYFLRRFSAMLQVADKKPEEQLSYTILQELEDRKDKAVAKSRREYTEYKRSQERAGEENDLVLQVKPIQRKRKKLHGQRRPMDTSEDKPRKKIRI